MIHHVKSKALLFSGLLVLGCLSISVSSHAQAAAAEGEEVEDSTEYRFQDRQRLTSGRASVSLDIYRDAGERRRIWHVALRSAARPTDVLCQSTLPLEAGADTYEFNLEYVESIDAKHLFLLDVRPEEGALPPDQPVYQIAFQVQPDDSPDQWRCHVIARGEHTQLDGGPVLSLDRSEEAPTLLRKDIVNHTEFCGLRADEDPGFERYDPSSGRFLLGAPVEIIVEDAGELSAEIPTEAMHPPLTDNFYTWVTASSDIRGAPVGAAVPRPLMLGDLDLSSAWVEGSDEGGAGEFVSAGINQAAKLRGMRIFPGHGRSTAHYRGYARPTQLLIGFSDGYRYIVDIPEMTYEEARSSGGVFLELPEPIITRCVSVIILESRPGELVESEDPNQRRLGRAVAISEIVAISSLDGDSENETARRIVDEMAREPAQRRRDRIARFGRLIPEAMIQSISDTLTTSNETKRARVVPLLGELKPETSLPILKEHFLRIPTDADDYRITKRTIASHGPSAAATLLEILEEVEQEDRKYVDTVRLVGRVGSDIHLIQLIRGLGQGDDWLRRERIRAIASGGSSVLPPLISAALSEGDTEAGLDALSTIVFVGQRHFDEEPATIAEAEELRQIYLQSTSRAHRIRAIEALGYFIHPEGVDLLGDQILAEDRDPVVRQFAASALRLYPADRGRERLTTALRDPSPDVRISAIQALNKRSDSHKATPAVAAYITTETWPRGLHHAANLLARSPAPLALDTLTQIITDEVQSTTAATALRALRREERSLSDSQISDLLANRSTPHRIRRQLVDMLALTETSIAETSLIAIASSQYAPLQQQPPEQLQDLAERALLALGKRRSPDATAFLLDVVKDDSRTHSERQYALRGLAFVADAELVDQLRDVAPIIPHELRPRLRETITQIRNRLAIEDAQRDLDTVIETLEENESERSNELPEAP